MTCHLVLLMFMQSKLQQPQRSEVHHYLWTFFLVRDWTCHIPNDLMEEGKVSFGNRPTYHQQIETDTGIFDVQDCLYGTRTFNVFVVPPSKCQNKRRP